MTLPPEDRDDLFSVLPEINEIKDLELRDQVADVFLNHAPDYFWEIPASSSGNHHQKDVIGDKGLLVHTKRSFTGLKRIERTFVKLGRVNEDELDYARAAVLLHDIFKQGLPPARGHTVDNHDVIAANYLDENTDLPDEVLRCIETHNGPWNIGDKPRNDLELMHHLADMIGSGKHIYSSVKDPEDHLKDIISDDLPKNLEDR